jgi:hypothetical protein
MTFLEVVLQFLWDHPLATIAFIGLVVVTSIFSEGTTGPG